MNYIQLAIISVLLAFTACAPETEYLDPELQLDPRKAPVNNTPTTIPCTYPTLDSLHIDYNIGTTILPPPQNYFFVGDATRYGDGYRIYAYSTSDKIDLVFYNGNVSISAPVEGVYKTVANGSGPWCVRISGNYGGSSFFFTGNNNQYLYIKNTSTPGFVEVYFCNIATQWQVFSNTGTMNIYGKALLRL